MLENEIDNCYISCILPTQYRTKSKNEVFYCCKGKIPFSVPVIEGVTKIVFICIGMVFLIFYTITKQLYRLLAL